MSDGEGIKILKSYRMRFLPVFVFMFVCLLIYGAVFYVAGFIRQESVALVLLASCLASMPVAWIIIVVFPSKAGIKGIRSYTSYGLFRTIAWQDIISVEQTGIPGLRALKIVPKNSVAIWVPLFLSRWEEFRETVIESAQNPDNPLVRHFLNKEEETEEEPNS